MKALRRLCALVMIGAMVGLPWPSSASYRGDYPPSSVLNFKFTTVATATGVPTALAGSPGAACYKDGATSPTTNSVSVTTGFNSITGLNNLRVDTSVNNGFFSEGSNFDCVLTAGTVGGTSAVGYLIASFSIARTTANLWQSRTATVTSSNGRPEVNTTHWNGTAVTSASVDVNVTRWHGTNAAATRVDSNVTRWNGTDAISTAVDVNVVRWHGTSAAATRIETNVRRWNGTDVISTAVTANTTQIAGAAVNTAAAQLGVNVVAISGDATAADNLEAALDGTGGVTISANLAGSVDSCTGCSSSGGTTIMPEVAHVKDSTSVVLTVFIKDSTTNLGKTGLTSASSGLTIGWGRVDQGNASFTTCNAQAATRGSYTSCGFVEKDTGHGKGLYEFGAPDALLADGADAAMLVLYGVSGTVPTILPIALVDVGLQGIASRIGTPAGASVSADVAAVKTDTAAVRTKTDQMGFTGANVNAITNAYASGEAPLKPATVGRTIIVSATGHAAVDWSKIEASSSTVNLSGTTVGVAGSVTGAVGSVASAVQANIVNDKAGYAVVSGTVTSVASAVQVNLVNDKLGYTAGGTIRKNVASQSFPIFLVSSTDHVTPATGKTVTVSVSKDGGAFAGISGSVGEIASGWYLVSLAQADTNCNVCVYRATASGTDDRPFYFLTAP